MSKLLSLVFLVGLSTMAKGGECPSEVGGTGPEEHVGAPTVVKKKKEIEAKFAVVALDGSERLTDALKAALNISSIAQLRSLVLSKGRYFQQGYLDVAYGTYLFNEELKKGKGEFGLQVLPFEPKEVRVRAEGSDTFVMTAKSNAEARGSERDEEPVALDAGQFEALYANTPGGQVIKTRLKVPYGRFFLEVDVYHGALEETGLITVEVEVPKREDLKEVGVLGLDVTDDKNYKNAKLAARSLK